MNRFKNILVVAGDTVGSDEALDRAIRVAQENNAVLTLLEVIEDQYAATGVADERTRRLERILGPIRATGLDVRSRVRHGKIFLEVTHQVLSHKHDLVIMAAEAPGGFRDLLFGSNSLHLMRKCPCPVWVLKPEAPSAYRRILAAVDIHPIDQDENAISHRIMQLATSLAVMDGATLHVVHAWDVTGNDAQMLQSELHDSTRNNIIGKHRRLAERRVNGFLQPYADRFQGLKLHIDRGEAWQTVTAVEQAENIDLIVMGTIDRAGTPGFFIGTTSETVLRQVNCSVLTVKPDQFVSPIALDEKVLYA